ncbi:MAG: hemolysin III family protein [Lactobacillales bacterium]|jgi:hemolysin III|nr:hemolysin III family protein [Lactobacillales bacterium]
MIFKNVRKYTPKEEVLHTVTHGIGIGLSIAILTVLVTLSSIYGNVWSVVSTAIFGFTMILMYSASTFYHAIPGEKAKKILKKFDHIAIYYLIAGTYTPFLLVLMRGTLGWTLFGIVWALAILGTILKLTTSGGGTKIWSIALYLGMGWLVVVASKTIFAVMSPAALTFLILGGLFYTVGILFYVWKSKAYTHAIWHCFVLLGTLMHFFSILFSCVFVG